MIMIPKFKSFLNARKSGSSIIATMLVFMMMSVAMSLLYSQISPTVIGYDASSKSSNQEFTFLNIETQVAKLVSLPQSSTTQVHMLSNDASFSVNSGKQVTFAVSGQNTSQFSTDLGLFKAEVLKNYQGVSNSHYLGRAVEENTLLTNQTITTFAFSVSRVDIKSGNATYWQYFRGNVNLVNQSNTFTLNIFIVQITADSVDFPISAPQWTLRLTRGATVITTNSVQANTNGLVLTQVDTQTVYQSINFPDIPPGSVVKVNYVVLPIIYGI